jgi:hypothetical protein
MCQVDGLVALSRNLEPLSRKPKIISKFKATHTLTKFGVTKNVQLMYDIDQDLHDPEGLWCKVIVLDIVPYSQIERKADLIPIPETQKA